MSKYDCGLTGIGSAAKAAWHGGENIMPGWLAAASG